MVLRTRRRPRPRPVKRPGGFVERGGSPEEETSSDRVQRKGRSPRWAPFLMVSQHGSPKKALAGFFNNSPLHVYH